MTRQEAEKIVQANILGYVEQEGVRPCKLHGNRRVCDSTINKMYSGSARLHIGTLFAVGRILGLDKDDLLTEGKYTGG